MRYKVTRLFAWLLLIALACTYLALPCFADDGEDGAEPTEEEIQAETEGERDPEDEELREEERGFWATVGGFFSGILRLLTFEINNNSLSAVLMGGYNYVDGDTPVNDIISAAYNITYPIGMAVLLLTWAFGIAKGHLISSLDMREKNSLLRAVLSLVIGLGAMTIAPAILSVLTSLSFTLCIQMEEKVLQLAVEYGHFDLESIRLMISLIDETNTQQTVFGVVILFVHFVLILNILWIALLQALSPIFVACLGNEGTRKLGMNFVKEYFKALLLPAVTTLYLSLVMALLDGINSLDLILALVLGFSTLGIAGKKLDKLIN